MDNELMMSISQELYDDLMAGKRDSIYLKTSQAWIARLIDGVTDGEARELAWQENRGRLQCALTLGRLIAFEHGNFTDNISDLNISHFGIIISLLNINYVRSIFL